MASADVTRFALTLGSRDSVTGWRAKSYAETTIRGSIQPKGSSKFFPVTGRLAEYEHTGYIPDVIHEGDIVKEQDTSHYRVDTAPQQKWLNQFDGYYPCECAKIKYPEVSITPPTPDEEDPRYRTRVWIASYLSLSCDWASIYAFPNYPLQYEFTGDNVTANDAEDTLFLVGQPNSTPLFTYDHYIYAYREQVPISIAVLEQYTQSNTEKLLWAAEDALRAVCRDYPLGSLRTLDVARDKTERHGNKTIAMREFMLNYKRDSGYVATYPRITWGDWCGVGEPGELDGTFIFPNVVRMPEEGSPRDAWLDIPSFSGTLPQRLGTKSLEIEMECDLDIAPYPSLTWKRPQTESPKDDVDRWDVFRDIWHNGGIDQPYQTLTLKLGGPSFKVCMAEPYRVEDTAEGRRLILRFREYRATSASGQTYKQRLGIS